MADLRQFEVVAFGCHERTHERLADFLEVQLGIQTFLFIEYFCEDPIPHAKGVEGWEKARIFFPFIRRIVENNQFVSRVRKITDWAKLGLFETIPKTESTIKEFRDPAAFILPGPHANVGRKVHEAWFQRSAHTYEEARIAKLVEHWAPAAWEDHISEIFARDPPADTLKILLREYGLAGKLWVDSKTDSQLFKVPVASASVFYGYLLLIVPGAELPDLERLSLQDRQALLRTPEEQKLGAVWKELHDLAGNLYLPVLSLFVESRFEADLRTVLLDNNNKENWTMAATTWFADTKNNPFRMACASAGVQKALRDDEKDAHLHCPNTDRHYAEDFELSFHKCWLRREQALGKAEDGSDNRLEFLQKFPLRKYFVASPGLVDVMRTVLRANIKAKKDGEGLACALVYGGPGSGKDVIAQLIALSSDDYSEHSIYTLNMAAIRPPAITGPLLQGLYLSGPILRTAVAPGSAEKQDIVQPPDQRTHLQGLFLQARLRKKEALKPCEAVLAQAEEELLELRERDVRTDHENKVLEQRENEVYRLRQEIANTGATFILDELNSLDVDLQGVLLRVLEQGEVTPLGGLTATYVQHLIVGVVNEDPEEITREAELRNLLVEKGKLGSLVSGFLYETLRRTRRLRDDVYHRLKRQLYIHLPALKDRPEDVPMLFYYNAKDVAKSRGTEGVIVELAAYRLLMDPKLTWPGNIRQIQAIAEKAVRAACNDRKTDEPPTNDLSILRRHVQAALEEEFRDVFGREDKPSRKNGYGDG